MNRWQRMMGTARTNLRAAKAAAARQVKARFGPEEPTRPLPRGEERDYSLHELASYDGSDPERPILLAVRGRVYDVTRGRDFYGPNGPYGMFAGKDCSRALAKMSFEAEDFVGDLDGLEPSELEKLDDWVDSFEHKYLVLGALRTP